MVSHLASRTSLGGADADLDFHSQTNMTIVNSE